MFWTTMPDMLIFSFAAHANMAGWLHPTRTLRKMEKGRMH
jgi:hypothetical protein